MKQFTLTILQLFAISMISQVYVFANTNNLNTYENNPHKLNPKGTLFSKNVLSAPPILSDDCGLGIAGEFNFFIFKDLTLSNTDSEGRIAVGKNANLSNYSVNSSNVSGEYAIIVGKDFTFTNGQINGGHAAYGNSFNGSGYGIPNGEVKKITPIDFSQLESELNSLSASLAEIPANGTADNVGWSGNLTLTGTNEDMNVFLISEDIKELKLNVPSGSTVLINIEGSSRNIGFNGQQFIDKSQAKKVIFNYFEASSLTIGSSGANGTILAPKASVSTTYSQINGSIIAKNLIGNIEGHHNLFNGCLSEPPSSTCEDISLSIETVDPSCGEKDGSITGTISQEKEPNGACIRYALYRYDDHGSGDWVKINQETPVFTDLSPGKYAIKKYQDKNCDGDFEIDNCDQRFPDNNSEYILLEDQPCPCVEISMEIDKANPSCDQNDGVIVGIPSEEEAPINACFRYGLYKYDQPNEGWVVTYSNRPEFSNLAPGKYRIKKFLDYGCDEDYSYEDCYQAFPSGDNYIILEKEPCCYEPSGQTEFSDGSCTYPANLGLIKMDEGFNDGETKHIYVKVDGAVCCGEVLLNLKTGGKTQCNIYSIAGPVCLEENNSCNTNFTEIGTYQPGCVSGLQKCEDVTDEFEVGGHSAKFNGWKDLGDGTSIWYYTISSGNKHAISHVTFGLIESRKTCEQFNSLGSFVWIDKNKNGIQDDGSEAGMPGVKVILYKDGQETDIYQYTDAFGKYLFTDLPNGMYQVKFMNPAEYIFTTKNMGNGQNDSKANPQNGMTDEVQLSGGQDYMFSDAGLIFSVLSVELTSFDARQSTSGVELTWETASEINSDYFEVQRSANGYTFETIAMVNAANQSSSALHYESFDDSPTEGINYYKLKQVDKDGTFKVSDTKTVEFKNNTSQNLSVFPNPFDTEISIRHSFKEDVQASLYNAAGILIKNFTLDSNRSNRIDTNDLESGMYYLTFQSDQTQKAIKIIKK